MWKMAPHSNRSRKQRGVLRPAFERLEDRCLLDAAPTQFGSADAYIQFVRDAALTSYNDLFGAHFKSYPYGRPGIIIDNAVPNTFTAQLAAVAGAPSFSQTNLQVSGVDEGDIVKTDGSFIYELTGQEMVIVDASATSIKIVSRTTIEGTPDTQYLDGDRLTVVSSIYDYSGGVIDPLVRSADGFPLVYPSNSKVKVTVFDVSDRAAPKVAATTYMDGSYITSRAIGHEVYVVDQNYFAGLPAPAFTNFNGENIYESKDAYLARITGHELDLTLPHYYTATGDPKNPYQTAGLAAGPAQIFKPRSANDYNLLTVAVFDDTGNTAGPVNSVSVRASYAATVYASLSHLYVALPRWDNNGSGGSEILQFSLSGSQVTLNADGVVPGQVVDRFSMDEHGQYFRIVTTANWGVNATTSLYVFTANSGTLDLVGSAGPLAPGERERTTRFVGDTAFIITFRGIDPLFAVDLSNPNSPRAVGELHFPGNTSYLQPLDATHLLGVGRSSGPFGSQLSIFLFDVSNLSAPTLVDQYNIAPQGWNWWWGAGSEAEWDSHAVGYFPEHNTLAIPIYGTYSSTNYSSFQSSLWVFHVDVNKGFQVLGQMNLDSQVRRSVRINDQLYAIATDSIQVAPIASPSTPEGEVRINDDPRFPSAGLRIAIQNTPFSGEVLNFKITDATGVQATIDWGDGQTSAGTIQAEADEDSRYTVSGSHTYTKLGSFTITISFTREGNKLPSLYNWVEVVGVDRSNLVFLQHVYQDLLQRTADEGGLATWGDLLQRNVMTRDQVALAIEHSVEYATAQVENLYQTLLGRAADAGGLNSFVSFLQSGGTRQQAEIAMLASQEFFRHAGNSNTAFLDAMYHAVLDRGVDPLGAGGWGGLLSVGVPRSQVAAFVLTSAEAMQHAVDALYEQSLHRAVDPNGATAFTTALNYGMSGEQALAIMMGSPEYFSRPA